MPVGISGHLLLTNGSEMLSMSDKLLRRDLILTAVAAEDELSM